ncbi:DUF2256 domain-containing protein [Salinarimonas chemoclinalis]|uniref:DUF2256 domain-containing protein n=1 Tax=Salinarimonas chemoclinalis TaxID=3241599 RepID=UPI003556C3F6
MPRMRRKADLPTKTCAACGRPFAWRKKWERDWENVRYCSDRCRADGRRRNPPADDAPPAPATPRSRA